MDRKVYFGNKTKQLWINAPQTGMNASSQSFISDTQLLNGRSHVTRSRGSHRRFQPSWVGSLNNAELESSLQTIKDFSDGVYGDGPFYWVDPFAKNQNLLPSYWAAPMMMQNDLPQIWDIAPFEYVDTASNVLNYPVKSPRYVSAETDEVTSTKKVTIIIPDGYTLFFGWHGVIADGVPTVRIDRHKVSDGSVSALDTTPFSVTNTNRTNASVSGAEYSRVDIYLYNPAGDSFDFTVAGMIAQLLPSSAYPTDGGFISGRGTSALEFGSAVNIEYYSSQINDGQIGLSTQWIEV